MKLNKWTAGLAAVGAVSLASVAQADEKASTLASASSTILSGYVDTSMQWNPGDGQSGIPGTPANSHAPAYKYGGPSKSDGFNLDAILITLEKPLDEAEWSAGYKVDLFMGPDANVLGTTSTGANNSDFAIKQAYVILNTPLGTGLDFKVGVFDSIIGYESTEADKNPNWTRSWGHTFEPSEHTGVLSTYRFNNSIAVSAGIADTTTPTINGRATNPNGTTSESYKAYMGALALTAPDDWGFLAGSSLDGGFVDGQLNSFEGVAVHAPQVNGYAGTTLNTPVTGLRFGFSWDYARVHADNGTGFTTHSFAAYSSYQATEKLSFHERVEYFDLSAGVASAIQAAATPAAGGNPAGVAGSAAVGLPSSVFSVTSTIQYDLWKNVLSRLELRWDRDLSGVGAFGGSVPAFTHAGYIQSGTAENEFILAANIIYKF
jgi:hypothetical protein